MSQQLQNQQSHHPTTQPPSTHRQGKSLLNASANPTRLLIDNILSRHDSPPEADFLLYLTYFSASTLSKLVAQLWHGQRRTRRTLRTKQRTPALHELVKPYLDVLILIRDVEAGGSNPLTPTKNSLLRRRDASLTDSFRSTVKV